VTAAEHLGQLIARHGPVPFSVFLEAALYGEGGFYASSGAAGRRGDFLTSPEVGPLFGTVTAAALDTWWDELGRPDPYVVADCGAGPGTLARSVLAAGPRCASALRYVLVERSAAQRARHAAGLPLVPPAEAFAGMGKDELDATPPTSRGPLCVSLAELPAVEFIGVVVANELLDNLPFDLLVHDGTWREARVAQAPDGRFVEVLVPPAHPLPGGLPPRPPHGSRAPVQEQAREWLADALGHLARGRVVIIDYTSATASMAMRPWREWLRTYRRHERGGHYLADVGDQDVTTEVALDQLGREPDAVRTQAQWLALHGIHELVAEGKRVWEEGAARGDLTALRARSRVAEAEALLDPSGLGGFTVAEWRVP
jgi:SAM-dependent MidA family methyltransferase